LVHQASPREPFLCMERFSSQLAALKPLNADTLELTFVPRAGSFPNFLAGQYVTIAFPGHQKIDRERPFSIVSAETQRDRITVAVKAFGKYTRALWQLRVGDAATVGGPYGSFTLPERRDLPVVLLAGGIGVTPFVSMVASVVATGDPRPMTLLWSVRSRIDAVYEEEMRQHAAALPSFRFALFVSDGQSKSGPGLRVGRIDRPALVEAAELAFENGIFYICGPTPFATAMRKNLHSFGVVGSRVRRESFALSPANALGLDTLLPRFLYAGAAGALLTLVFVVAAKAKPAQSQPVAPLSPLEVNNSIRSLSMQQLQDRVRQLEALQQQQQTTTSTPTPSTTPRTTPAKVTPPAPRPAVVMPRTRLS